MTSRLPVSMRSLSLASGTVLLLVADCGKTPEQQEDHAFQILEEEGIEVALTTGGPKYTGELFEYVPLLTLQEDEREESLFNQPGSFLMDEDGNYFVADFGDHRISVYDDQGRYSFAIGRQGEGPGEFEFPGLQEIYEGVISVYDIMNRRTSRFSTDGTFLDVRTMSGNMSTFPGFFLHFTENRMLILEDNSDSESDGRYESISATVIDAAGDTVWTRRTDRVKTGFAGMRRYPDGRERATTYSLRFGYSPSWGYHRDTGIVFSEGFDPQLDIYDFTGNLKRRIRIEFEPTAPTREDLAYTRAYYKKRLEEAEEDTRYLYESYLKNLKMADIRAPWTTVEVDDAGYFWLMVGEPVIQREEAGEGYLYRIVSPEGEYLGDSRQPRGYGVVQHGRFLCQTTDPDTDAYILTVYEIRPAVPGLIFP